MSAMYRVALVVFPGVRAFEVSIATEVWGVDRTPLGVPPSEIRRCSDVQEPLPMSGGLTLVPDRDLSWLRHADLVLVPGIENARVTVPAPVISSLRQLDRSRTPIAALCTGIYVLARAGLLDGHRATTHWLHARGLSRRHPSIRLDSEALFTEDAGVWTSAGGAASIDLCLHLVRLSHGAEAAATVARTMVTAPFRSGDHAQRLDRPVAPADRNIELLAAVCERALANLDQPLTVSDLVQWAGMSPRTFARHFAAVTGTTPQRWILQQRLAAAQRLLERTDLSVAEIAVRSGFVSAITMRQHFARRMGVSPRDYRKRFTKVAAP
ncbi:GlxA family transcriptional regulator [Streptomyces venetus]|uniref:GlxA family transcriptional regulator n=1 Tax=Streptomyces venetus TaxID=1701086 RepID=UPI003C2F5415